MVFTIWVVRHDVMSCSWQVIVFVETYQFLTDSRYDVLAPDEYKKVLTDFARDYLVFWKEYIGEPGNDNDASHQQYATRVAEQIPQPYSSIFKWVVANLRALSSQRGSKKMYTSGHALLQWLCTKLHSYWFWLFLCTSVCCTGL